MTKSGQLATKADTGGQRIPKSKSGNAGDEKKAPQKSTPVKKELGKKSGT